MANIIYFRTVKVQADGNHEYFKAHETLNGSSNEDAEVLKAHEGLFRITKEEYCTRSKFYEFVPCKGTIVTTGIDDITNKPIQEVIPFTMARHTKQASKAGKSSNSTKLGKKSNTARPGKFLRNDSNRSKKSKLRLRWRENRRVSGSIPEILTAEA